MENQKLLTITLVIAVVALGISIFATYYAVKSSQQLSGMQESIDEMKEVTGAFEPLLPEVEALKTVLPRVKTLLLSVPPTPSE